MKGYEHKRNVRIVNKALLFRGENASEERLKSLNLCYFVKSESQDC